MEIVTFIFEIFKIALVGTVTFIFLKMLSKLIRIFFSSRDQKNILPRIFIVVEIFIWIVFLIWSINLIITIPAFDNLIVISVLAVLFALVIWFAGRDAVSGIILRLENSLNLSQNIQTPFGSGAIQKFGLRVLSLESEKGEIFYIPYSKLSSDKIISSGTQNRFKSFETEINIEKSTTPKQIKQAISKTILYSPYCSVKRLPHVDFLGEENDYCRFRIILYALNSDYFNKLIFTIKKDLSRK